MCTRADRDDKAVVENNSEFFSSVFTAEILGDISTATTLFIESQAEEICQTEINSGNARTNKELRC